MFERVKSLGVLNDVVEIIEQGRRRRRESLDLRPVGRILDDLEAAIGCPDIFSPEDLRVMVSAARQEYLYAMEPKVYTP